MTEHDERLQRVLERLESAGLKLNAEKCVLRQRKLHFLGQVIDADGVRPDPAKVSAINNLSPPENVQELKRVLGLVNYLGKYIPNLATVGQPLYELLKSNSVLTWGPAQMSAFQQIKEPLTTSPTLKYYDVSKPTAVSADASSYGIGAVLMQLHGQEWRAVAYCSRRLSDAETRCQRLLMRLMRFNPTAEYAPEGIPATKQKIDSIRAATEADEEMQILSRYIQSGWPEHIEKTHPSVSFSLLRSELSVHSGLVTRGTRIIIPKALRAEILDRIHNGHLGLSKCRERANTSVWWPGISSQIKVRVLSCQSCNEHRRAQSREPLLSTPLPGRPWKRIGVDLCEHKKQNCLVVSDYYSRYIEILHMPVTTSAQVVKLLKATFVRYGIPEEVVSDNGPQFTSLEFKELARELDFTHITSSPHNPQGNGHAERAVQTAKRILYQKDPLLALMCYRATPCNCMGASPAELLMGHKIRTTLPTLESNLRPKWPSRKSIKARDTLEKQTSLLLQQTPWSEMFTPIATR
ncbi:hypothetical protein MHYP_G00155550 [Metynnis hypsauchen]